ncbi:MAG TPA: MFS transporter [Aestuariivirgaceae bacterium]|jgi:FSR family fosmidomycin resistance protein-like MFS transporter|nr:MFS transporter [Aestuariivirgaceae bacterium]
MKGDQIGGNGAQASSRLEASGTRRPRRVLTLAGIAHALHDGYTDLIYVLLPVWQAEFALGYGMLAVVRGLYAGAMAALQLPAGLLAERFGARSILVAGTALAAIGFAIAGLSGSLIGLCIGLSLSGAGSSTQHPIASTAVARAYGGEARGPLGTYNFTGDLGKAAFPPLTAMLLTMMPWRASLEVLALIGLAVAVVIALMMPRIDFKAQDESTRAGEVDRNGFWILFAMGVLDSAVRMALLTFLPFLLQAKGASLPVIGLALAAVFIGGAAGKFVCGPLGKRLGMLHTVILTEVSTAVLILSVLGTPLTVALVLMPVLGFMLNGTSSVLYGTVPELVRPDQTARAFALFYTGTIGSGALTPILYGFAGDVIGAQWATVATAVTALAVCPLALMLQATGNRQ